MLYPHARILIFAKPPVVGHCKTRLGKTLGLSRAARVHRLLSEQTFNTVAANAIAPVEIHAGQQPTHPWFLQQRRRYGWPLRQQVRGNLGKRMYRAAHQILQTADACLIVGTDCPVLDRQHLFIALEELQSGQNIVLLPSEDGGYALIGLNRADPLLFRNISWGTGQVMRQTRRRLQHARLNWTELAPVWDVDEAADFYRAKRAGLL